MSASITFTALQSVGEIRAGDDLAAEIIRALTASQYAPRAGDVLVVAQKVVSKAEGRFVSLRNIAPSAQAHELARITGKDARLIEAVLAQTDAVVRAAPNVLIVRTRKGYVAANAGIDRSNIDASQGEPVLLLPLDPDASAAGLSARISAWFDAAVGVIVSDSFGRPWRKGVVNVALGVAGLPALLDRRGEQDRYGRKLEMTEVGYADAIAAGAGLAMGEAAEGTPVVLARGLQFNEPHGVGRDLIRPASEDLFR